MSDSINNDEYTTIVLAKSLLQLSNEMLEEGEPLKSFEAIAEAHIELFPFFKKNPLAHVDIMERIITAYEKRRELAERIEGKDEVNAVIVRITKRSVKRRRQRKIGGIDRYTRK